MTAWGDKAKLGGEAPAPPADPLSPASQLFVPTIPAARYATALAAWRRLLDPPVASHRLRRPISNWLAARRDGAVARRFAKTDRPSAPAGSEACVVGIFGGRNGVSRAARYDLDRVFARFPGAAVVDVSKGSRDGLAAYAATHAARPPAVIVFLLQPDAALHHLRGVDPAFLRDAYRIVLGVWEVPCFPPRWRHADLVFHEYWTPSAFAARALADGGPHRTIEVLPHDVRLPEADAADTVVAVPNDVLFHGLAIMDLSVCPDRKNPWAHMEAWRKAFGGDPRFLLTIKARFSPRTRCIRRELMMMIGGGADIRLLEVDQTDGEVLALQRAADVGLSLHRSEGFGLTIREMLAIGRPVVATGWSGNMEYMEGHPLAHAVRHAQVPYRDYLRRYPNYRGTWAEADTDHAARCLRAVAGARVAPVPAAPL